MPTPLRRRLRLTRRYALYALAFVLMGVALLVGTLSQLLPMVEEHPDKVAAWLSERAGQPVAFDALDTAWTRRGPLLRLDGLRIGSGEGVKIGQAEVLVSLYSGLFPGASFTELRLRGLSLTLQRDDDGRWSVRGLPSDNSGGDPLDALRKLGELQVIGGRLQVDAPSIGIQAAVPRLDLRVRVNGDRVRVGVKGWIEESAAPLAAVLDFKRGRGDGSVWLSATPADLAPWSSLLHFAGLNLEQGKGKLSSWIQLQDNRVVSVITDADMRDLTVSGNPLDGESKRPSVVLDTLQLRARWTVIAGGWRVDAPRLRVGSGKQTQQLDGLLVAGGEHFALQGEQVDISTLLRVGALSDQLDPGLRSWLQRSQPTLRFSHVNVAGNRGGALRGSGELDVAAFAAVGGSPGISGLSGHFEGDGEGVALTLEPSKTLHFDWPTGFGVVHDVQLAGQIVGWREGAGWRVETPAMRVQGTDYAADVRGGLWFQGDGTRPWMQLAAKLDDVPMTAAKRFWVRSKMSKTAIDWLDSALVGGYLRNGTGLVTGDLDDWPFDAHDGRFEAGGRIDNGSIRFNQNWPAMQKVDADITFIANGFQLHGQGDLAGVAVDHFDAGIADFAQSRLQVKATSQSDGKALLAMLRQSPLHARYADTLDNLSVTGPTAVNFDLLQPLHGDDNGGHLTGDVELRGAQLADKRWDLQFDNVRGKAIYSDGGFEAPTLAVRHRGQDGTLSLRAGDHVVDPSQVFEAGLSAALDAGSLLDRAPELAWLKPHIQGTSQWTIGVTLPKVPAGSKLDPPTTLQLHSDLVGTRLMLPAPLSKPASAPLATSVKAALPLGSGTVEVGFGQLLALAARTRGDQTGVQVTLGSDHVDREPPSSGLVVTGSTPSLDALEWIALARGTGGDSGSGTPSLALKHVDVQAAQLLLAGGLFTQTRLQLSPSKDAVAVQLDGPSLAGSLVVPAADGGTISGTLARVYWKTPPADTDSSDEPAAPADPIDPSKVPPLALDIQDLQFAGVKLGQTRLRTHPTPTGLKVDQLQFRSDKQAIDVLGDWTGVGERAATRVSAHVQSENMGALMQNLGYGGQLRGGHGDMQLEANWPGGPSQFALGNLQGSLTVNAHNGQLLEVDPGAGRVLGLLSVTQLPRRLMLDFRDFFSKGLAFNQIEGQIRFADGMARTDKVSIEGPAADIVIRGQTDLRTQQFDQTIDVNPRSGNLLTVVGAVAGGPIGAAVGAAANAVLSKPLSGIGAKTYKVTGPWKEPKVEVIERETPRAPPPVVPAEPANSRDFSYCLRNAGNAPIWNAMTDNALTLAETRLLLPAGLDASGLERTFGTLLGPGVDFGDLYFQHARRESWSVEDGIVKDGAHSIEQGVGVRAIAGEKTGFAYSDDIHRDALLAAAQSARAISREGGAQNARSLIRGSGRALYPALDPIDSIGNEAKVEVLKRLDQFLRAADSRVQQVMVSLSGGVDTVLIARSDGVLAADVRPLVRLNVQVIVEQNGRRESGYAGGGGRYSYEELFADGRPEGYAREALRQALVNLEAIPAPAGVMQVVLGPGWPGVLLHEAVGHGLEGDFNRKGTSVYAGRVGERVASPGVTIVDDGTLDGRRGSLNIDDEGTPTQCTTLIEDGILVGYMQDTLNARLMGVKPTGNGRRESFAHMTMPRMTNTYMRAGEHDPQEMIRSVKKGLYAVNFGGGQVDITSGKYVFSATEAYLIEDGKITAPVKGATLIGNGPETMQKVGMIGNDLALDEGVGICGKDGQSVPVGVGQPSLLIDGITVGGTQA